MFEFWQGPDFDPVDVTPGERLLLRVRVEGRPEKPSADRKASYLLFGARQGCYFGTAVNTYGTEQLWAGLKPIFNDRSCLAFQLLKPGSGPPREERFGFARRIATNPRDQWTRRRRTKRKAAADGVEITGAWRLRPVESNQETMQLAAEDLPIFLGKVMGVQLARANAGSGPFFSLKYSAATRLRPSPTVSSCCDRSPGATLGKGRSSMSCRLGATLAQTDSRYGYANYGRGEQSGLGRGGMFSPVSIERKIAQVEHMLDSELPKLRAEIKE